MCRKIHVCPKYDPNNKYGIDGVCKHCEYLKKERKRLFILRTLLVIAFGVFLITTYSNFHMVG